MHLKSTLLALFIAAAASGQTPTLVSNMATGKASSQPLQLTVFNSSLVFAAFDQAHGYELWKSDGSTTNPATRIIDLYPGTTYGVMAANGAPVYQVFNGNLYFCGQDTAKSWELFRYNGTNVPTLAVDLVPGADPSFMTPVLVSGTKLFCTATTPASGFELFTYDGSATTGPVLYDINPGADDSDPSNFIEFNSQVYFRAKTPRTGYELFRYDAATNTTALAADINTGVGNGNPGNMVVANGKLYFTAETAAMGRELYSFDGTTATRLTDLASGTLNGVNKLVAYNGKLYLSGSTNGTTFQLYSYDFGIGTTTLVSTINPSGNSLIDRFKVLGTRLYFMAYTPTAGLELWSSNGTTASMVADINPGAADGVYFADFCVFNNTLYFGAGDTATSGYELYKLTTGVGVQSVGFDGSVRVYPNPAIADVTLELTLQTARDVVVTLHDAMGRKVYESSIQHGTVGKTILTLPTVSFPEGLYQYGVYDVNHRLLQSGSLLKR